MKAKQYKLSQETTYTVIKSMYLSLLDGGGWCCENCGRIITNMVTVESKEGKQYIVGSDCASTLAGINKQDNENIKHSITKYKRFYKELIDNFNSNIIVNEYNQYSIINIVSKGYSNESIQPFIGFKYVSIPIENGLSDKYSNRIITKAQIQELYPTMYDFYLKTIQ
jgi:hypothetical protein